MDTRVHFETMWNVSINVQFVRLLHKCMMFSETLTGRNILIKMLKLSLEGGDNQASETTNPEQKALLQTGLGPSGLSQPGLQKTPQ